MTSGSTTISRVCSIDNLINDSLQTTYALASTCFLWILSIKVVVDVTFPRIYTHKQSDIRTHVTIFKDKLATYHKHTVLSYTSLLLLCRRRCESAYPKQRASPRFDTSIWKALAADFQFGLSVYNIRTYSL